MSKKPDASGVILAGAALLLTWLGACAPPAVQIQGPTDLPGGLEAVLAARSEVEVSRADPLTQVADGTVRDDLAGLDGCWASYELVLADEATEFFQVGDPVMEKYSYHRFDTAAGTWTWDTYADLITEGTGLPEGLDFASAASYWGTFELTGDNALSMIVEGIRYFEPATGTWFNFPQDAIAAVQADTTLTEDERQAQLGVLQAPLVWDVLATIDGDRLKLAWLNQDDPNALDSYPDVLIRFDCVE
jgi:hypothetical protein